MKNSQAHRNADIKRLAIRGVVLNWTARVCSIFIAFFLTPFVVRSLGADVYGVWSIIMSFTSYYALADLGLRGAGERHLAQFIGAGDTESAGRVAVTSLAAFISLAAALMVIVLGVAWMFPWLFGITSADGLSIRWVVIVTGATVAVRLVGQTFSVSLAAVQRYDLLNVVGITSQLLQAVGFLAVLRSSQGLIGLASVTFVLAVVAQVALGICSLIVNHEIPLSVRLFDRKMLGQLFQFGGVNLYANLARQATRYIGGIVIGLIAGPAMVTFYAISESLARYGQDIGMGVTSVIGPLASRLDGQNRLDALQRLLITGGRVLTACALTLAMVSVVMGHSFLSFWIGFEYAEQSYPILVVLSCGLVALMPSNSLRMILYATGRLRIFMATASIELAVVLILGPLLVYGLGVIGMAWAILAANILTGAIILPYHTCRALQIPLGTYVTQVFMRAVASVAPATVVAVALKHAAPASTMGGVILEVVLVCAVAVAVTFCVGLDRSLRQDLLCSVLPSRWRTGSSAGGPRRDVNPTGGEAIS